MLTCLTYEDLRGVILAGHSYAGMVITGVAEQAKDRIGKLVYVDAFVPRDGDSALSLLPAALQQTFRDQARSQGDGWRLKSSERQLDLWGLRPGPAREFVRSKLCDFSLRCFEQSLRLPTHAAASLDRSYVACVAPTGHDSHVELPDELAAILLDLA